MADSENLGSVTLVRDESHCVVRDAGPCRLERGSAPAYPPCKQKQGVLL